LARAHFTTYLTDAAGNVIPGATVVVREPDTETAISETIYAEDDTVGNTEHGNPFTADADGRVALWLDIPKVVDLYVTKTGYDPRTIRAVVHQLTASTQVVLVQDVAMDQRSGLNFGPGFVGTDDSVEDETEIDLDFGETADVSTQAFSDAASGGALDEVARVDHKHAMPANPVTTHESTYDHGDIALAATAADLSAHLADTGDAHDASAISVADAGGLLAATDVEAALAEIQGALNTDEAALAAHLADAADAHDASAISIADAAGDFTATDVEGALAELQSDAETHAAAADPHTGYQKESEKNAANGYLGLNADARPPFAGGARLTLDADRSIAGSGADVQFLSTATLTEEFDTGGWFTAADSKFVVPDGYAGKVRVQAHITIEGNSSGNRTLRIAVAGTDVVADKEFAPAPSTPAALAVDTGPIVVAEADEILFYATQSSGSALNVKAGSWVSVEFLGA
jgi:hypothetical protein